MKLENFLINKKTLWISPIVFILNIFFGIFGYGVMGNSFEIRCYLFFFKINCNFHSSYAHIFIIIHLIIAGLGLIIFLTSLGYNLYKKFKK